jgi:hypothetical protein
MNSMNLRLLGWIKVNGRETQSLKNESCRCTLAKGESKFPPAKFNQHGAEGAASMTRKSQAGITHICSPDPSMGSHETR